MSQNESVSYENLPDTMKKVQAVRANTGATSNVAAGKLGLATMGANDQRMLRYRSRIEAALEGLQKDMGLWAEAIPADGSTRALRHHIEQFRMFASRAYMLLVGEEMRPPSGGPPAEYQPMSPEQTDREDFREMVAGVLTGQWLLLRNAIVQRVEGSPYRGKDKNSGIQALDADARRYYLCLYKVLNARLEKNSKLLNWRYRSHPLVRFAPLVHLGTGIQLAVFNRRTPLIISVPVGASAGDAKQ